MPSNKWKNTIDNKKKLSNKKIDINEKCFSYKIENLISFYLL